MLIFNGSWTSTSSINAYSGSLFHKTSYLDSLSLVLWALGCRMPRWLVQWAHLSTPAPALAGITLSRKHLEKTPAFWMPWPIYRCTCHPSCLQRLGYICCSLLETRCSTCQNSINLSCTYYYACTNRWCGRDSNPSLQQLLSQKVQTALDYYLFHQTHMPQQNVLAAGHLDWLTSGLQQEAPKKKLPLPTIITLPPSSVSCRKKKPSRDNWSFYSWWQQQQQQKSTW